ncbi:MAG: hypothetical protein ACK4JX_04475 [Flavobacterium sp.]
MALKILHYIRNKKELTALYLSQFTEEFIREEINDIIRMYRPSYTIGMRVCANRISDQEFLQFVEFHGVPSGYILSEEMQIKLKYLKDKKC